MRLPILDAWYKPRFLTVLLALALCMYRFYFAFYLQATYVDSDQPFMWAGLNDYAAGHFYEPRFYGQNYNSFFEALAALPLYALGISLPMALAMSTALLSLVPYLLLALVLYKKKRYSAALWVLATAAIVSPQADVLCSIPRGFSPGLFLCSGLALSVMQPGGLGLHLLNALLSGIGVVLNPNAWPVYIVLWLLVFLQASLNLKKAFLLLSLMIAAWLIADTVFNRFYREHPETVVYGLTQDWSLSNGYKALLHVADYFNDLGPLGMGGLWMLSVFCVSALLIYRKHRRMLLALLALAGLVTLSFCNGKLQEGSLWPYYSYSRFFLPLPFIIAVFYYWWPEFTFGSVAIFLAAMGFLFYKSMQQQNFVSSLGKQTTWIGVHLISTRQAETSIDHYQKLCHEQHCDTLLVSNGFWLNTVLAYGGTARSAAFPVCTETRSERRYWVRNALMPMAPKRFMCLSTLYDLDQRLRPGSDFNLRRIDDYGLYLVESNRLNLKTWSQLINTLENPSP